MALSEKEREVLRPKTTVYVADFLVRNNSIWHSKEKYNTESKNMLTCVSYVAGVYS